MVELLTLTLVDGTVIRWASTDATVTYGGNVWAPGPVIEREGTKLSIGIAVTSCTVTFHADDTITVIGVPLLQAARRGLLGGAEIKIEKGFTDDPANPIAGLVHLFEGRIGDVEINSTSVQCEVKSFTELLDTMVPRNVFQTACLHTLYSAGCGVSKAANSLGLSAVAGTTAGLLVCGVSGAGVYDLGELVCTSGVNAGVRRAVKQHAAGQLLLSFPFPDVPAVGDTFTVYKGCDKTLGTCKAKFANGARFKGFPFVPAPETAV
ncbi:MAG: DUF2163 domain-containing protein [Armatimonadia bacterium]